MFLNLKCSFFTRNICLFDDFIFLVVKQSYDKVLSSIKLSSTIWRQWWKLQPLILSAWAGIYFVFTVRLNGSSLKREITRLCHPLFEKVNTYNSVSPTFTFFLGAHIWEDNIIVSRSTKQYENTCYWNNKIGNAFKKKDRSKPYRINCKHRRRASEIVHSPAKCRLKSQLERFQLETYPIYLNSRHFITPLDRNLIARGNHKIK